MSTLTDPTFTVDTPYARCVNCGHVCVTPDDAAEHRSATVSPETRRSHATRILNPTRKEQARSQVRIVVDDALAEAVEELDEMVERGDLDTDEVTAALSGYPDFSEAWDDYLAENGGAS